MPASAAFIRITSVFVRAGVAASAVVLGCSGKGDREQPGQGQDAAPRMWSLHDSAVYSVAEGRGNQQAWGLFDRPANAVILADGRAIVGNRQNLVFLGSDGTPYAVAGRAGSGPAEFSGVHAVFPTANGVAAYDLNRRSVLLFSAEARHEGEIPLPPHLAGQVVAVMDAKGIVVWVRPRSAPYEQHVLVDSAGKVSDPYGAWSPARRMDVPVVISGLKFSMVGKPGCTAVNLSAAIGRTVFVAEQASGTIYAMVPGGEQRAIYRLPERTVDDVVVADMRRLLMKGPGGEAAVNAILASFGAPGDPFPWAWDRMIGDPSGRLWARRVMCGLASDERLWDIVDTTGVLQGQLRTNRDLLAINGSNVLTLRDDSITVSMYRVR